MQKIGWILLLVATIGDFAVPYILAPFYKGYNHEKQVMSVLGNPESPVRIPYNFWLVSLGILLLISTKNIIGLYSSASYGFTIILVALMSLFAIGAGILAGIFSVNKTKQIKNLPSKIHGISSALGFMAMSFAPLFLSILSVKKHDNVTAAISGISFILTLFFFVLFILSDKETFTKTKVDNEGLWQRLSLFFMYVPFMCVAIKGL